MTNDEIDYICRIMYTAVHSNIPYVEDYYYQARLSKITKSRNRNIFVPQQLRNLNENMKQDTTARFVSIEGLGKIVYSNIRTPKVLMDLSADDMKDATPGPTSRPLEQEPYLAARMLIEDCVNLLLDIDDIDRIVFVSGPDKPDFAYLRHRRAVLLNAVLASLRLPAGPSLDEPDTRSGGVGDAVFQRVVSLPKGRTFIARTLNTICEPEGYPRNKPPSEPHFVHPCYLVWAVLRSICVLFSPPELPKGAHADPLMHSTTCRLAMATSKYLDKMDNAQELVQCMVALADGLKNWASIGKARKSWVYCMLPLEGTAAGAWSHTVLTALFGRGTAVLKNSPLQDEWRAAVESVQEALSTELTFASSHGDMQDVHLAVCMKACGELLATSSSM